MNNIKFQRPAARYRPSGQLEYLVNPKTGFVICASPFMRIDTFEYRNKHLNGFQWISDFRKAKEIVKIATHGRLTFSGKNSGIFFYTKNLKYDSKQKMFTCDGLHYFDGISSHDIVIKNEKTGVSRTFEHKLDMYQSTPCGGVIKWECTEDKTLTFVLEYKHYKK